MKLEAIGIGRRVGTKWLLRDVTFSVQAGDRTALVGATGSGKSLLLRSLAMLDPLDAGEITWCGDRVSGPQIPEFRSRVIYLHQRPGLIEGTVEDNLRQPFSLQIHQTRQFQREEAVSLLERIGQDQSFLDKEQRDLSGGESQLTALLRAIQLSPNILLLDEPTAALDSNSTERVESLVDSWLNEESSRRAVVWVTHDRQQAERVSKAIREIRDGELS